MEITNSQADAANMVSTINTANTPYVLTTTCPCVAPEESKYDVKSPEVEYTYVTLEFRVPRKTNSITTLVRDYMGIASDKDAELMNLRITENRW